MRLAIAVMFVAIAPTVAAAQGRVVVDEGTLGPQLDPHQSVLFVKTADTVTMAVQPRFTVAGPGTRFAVLLATPAPPLYGTDRPTLFDELAVATAPRIEEEVTEVQDPSLGSQCTVSGGCGSAPRTGGVHWPTPDVPDGSIDDGPVEVIPVGPYEVLRLTAADTAELTAWLDQFGYLYTQDDLDAIAPYLARGDVITAVRVIVEDPGTTALEVLTLTWTATELQMPLALGRPAAGQTAQLAVYISAIGRHDVGVTTPDFAANRPGPSPEFLTRTTIAVSSASTIDNDPFAAPSLDGGEIIPIEYVGVTVRVPVYDCDFYDEDASAGCCDARTRGVRWDAILVALAVLLTFRRRRPAR